MTYQTGSGTLQTMLNGLATFLITDGWTTRTPGAHRYWSLLGYSLDAGVTSVSSLLVFTGSGGSYTDVTNTIDAWSATGGTPANAITLSGWDYTGSQETRLTMDFGAGVTQAITQFSASTNYRFVALEYSDDGVVWKTAKSWMPRTLGATGSSLVGTLDATYFPLSPDGGDNIVMPVLEDNYQSTKYDELSLGTTEVSGTLVRLNVGDNAVLPLGLKSSDCYPMNTDVEEYHFFSDPTVSLHFHVAFRVVFGARSYWYHFSGGELNKMGMSHHGVVYATASLMTPFSRVAEVSPVGLLGAYPHNALSMSGYFMGGIEQAATVRYSTIGDSSVNYCFTQSGGSGFPLPNDAAWPPRGSTTVDGEWMVQTVLPRPGADASDDQWSHTLASTAWASPGSVGWTSLQHPTTGFSSMGSLPFILSTGNQNSETADFCMLGEFPNVKTIRIDLLEATSIVAIGSDEWMCFPLLRKTEYVNSIDLPRVPLSGPSGMAYKKVA